MKVVHVISGLKVGGAELMLLKLLQEMDRTRWEPVVVSLQAGGPVADRIRALGVPVHEPGPAAWLGLPLWRLARRLAPDVVQGWMYHGNVAASLFAQWAPGRPQLYWNIRHTLPDLQFEKPLTRLVIRLGARWSGRARQVVHNAQVSVVQHEAVGFARGNGVVIPNGFDLERYRPDPAARTALRHELGLPDDALLVGTLGRHHPIKGHTDFLAALARMKPRATPVHALCAGSGLTLADPELAALAVQSGWGDRLHLLGPRDDTPRYLAALDVFCLPSRREGFPNALGEAMACGVPCVSTDAGEATIMLEGLEPTVPPADPAALALALDRMLDRDEPDRRRLGAAGRARMAERYALSAVAARYEEMYLAGADDPPRR